MSSNCASGQLRHCWSRHNWNSLYFEQRLMNRSSEPTAVNYVELRITAFQLQVIRQLQIIRRKLPNFKRGLINRLFNRLISESQRFHLTSMKSFDLCINKFNSTTTHGCFLKREWQMKNLTSESYRKSISVHNGARCFDTWNRYSVKRICAIDSLFITLVDTSYWQSDMCKIEWSQKYESRDQSADSFKRCSKTRALVVGF